MLTLKRIRAVSKLSYAFACLACESTPGFSKAADARCQDPASAIVVSRTGDADGVHELQILAMDKAIAVIPGSVLKLEGACVSRLVDVFPFQFQNGRMFYFDSSQLMLTPGPLMPLPATRLNKPPEVIIRWNQGLKPAPRALSIRSVYIADPKRLGVWTSKGKYYIASYACNSGGKCYSDALVLSTDRVIKNVSYVPPSPDSRGLGRLNVWLACGANCGYMFGLSIAG